MLKDLPDLVLWDAVKTGDQKAFNVLFDRYWSVIYKTAYRYTGDKEACFSITHDIFIALWQKREELQIQTFQAYLTAAARYHVYRYIKALQSVPVCYFEPHQVESPAAEMNEGEQRINKKEIEEDVFRSVQSLPRRCQEIFVLSRYQHITNTEIAEKLGISKRTVENQLTYALKHLRASMKSIMSLFF